MWVVKIGGSLLSSEHLRGWLDAIACYGAGSVVVVPGGGVFADQVRSAQRYWGYDDAVAHQMALLAMEQYGIMMTGLRPDLAAVRSLAALTYELNHARVPVWLPRDMALADPDLPPSWYLTSDSLAAWLAQNLAARRLLLIKSRGFDTAELGCETVARSGVVDPLFCEYVRGAGLEAWICGPEAHTSLRNALYAESGCGTRITCVCAGDERDPASLQPGIW